MRVRPTTFLAALLALACLVLLPATALASPPVWSEDFTGPAGTPPDPSHWQMVTGDWSGGDGEQEYYSARPANVSLDGAGHLAIVARRQPSVHDGLAYGYTSGRLQTKGLFQTTYGTLEARIKLPRGQGLWPAFWALGADIDQVGWPASGEIDMMENLGSDPFTVYGSLHGPSPGSPDGYGLTASYRAPSSLAAGFHTYGVTWSPSRIVFTADGVAYSTRTSASLGGLWVFDKPFYLLLNLAVGGGWPGPPGPTTRFPATMLVDWVRVYS